jgi:hypothetical protein
MKPFTFTDPSVTMLQNLRARNLQLDRTIRELEAYATLTRPFGAEQTVILPPAQTEESPEQWLQ